MSNSTGSNQNSGVGAASGTTSAAAAVVSNTVLQSLQEEYQHLDEFRGKLLTLQFFALCPNGKRIPVEKICEEYDTNPSGLALRTLEDRLVLVLQAMFPGEDTPYWQQAFYLSTGMNSGMPNTWLPFDGIVMKGLLFRPSPPRQRTKANEQWLSRFLFSQSLRPTAQKTINAAQQLAKANHGSSGMGLSMGQSMTQSGLKPVMVTPSAPAASKKQIPQDHLMRGSLWFSKQSFHNYRMNNPWYRNSHTINTTDKNTLLSEIYMLYLPEGDVFKSYHRFDRFGCISYALASHAIGGDLFQADSGKTFFLGNSMTANEAAIGKVLDTPSPFQTCWSDIVASYPISKPYQINGYIEQYKGFSYMNTFRQHNIFPPGLSFINTPLKSMGYSIPFYDYYVMLTSEVHKLWRAYKLGETSIEYIRTTFAKPELYAKTVLKRERKSIVFPDEPEFYFNVVESHLDPSRPITKYLGGRGRGRKTLRSKRSKSKKTRKALY